MDLNAILQQKNMTKYHLAKISGVPKTTIADICAGRSSIGRCSSRTVWMLAKALGCSMEDLMELDDGCGVHDVDPGLPEDPAYLECGLPLYLRESIDRMRAAWERKEREGVYLRFDEDYCELQSNINCAEVNQEISSDQAWHLRGKYLGLERE